MEVTVQAVSLPAELPSPNTQRAERQHRLQSRAAWKWFCLRGNAVGGRKGGGAVRTGDPDLYCCRQVGCLPPLQTSFKTSVVGSHLTSCLMKHPHQVWCSLETTLRSCERAESDSWFPRREKNSFLTACSLIQRVSLLSLMSLMHICVKHVIYILSSDWEVIFSKLTK